MSTRVPEGDCAPRQSRIAGTADGRASAARARGWMDALPEAADYNAVAIAKETKEAGRSDSSKKVHKAMRESYLAFCAHLKVDPSVVDQTTAAHVANFYKFRTKNYELGLSTSKHISAQMGIYFDELGYHGPWTTGDIDGKIFVNGNPNESKQVADNKRTHKIKLAAQGRVAVPMDPLEYGHMCSYYDHFLADHRDVSPNRLCQWAAIMVGTFNLMRFDEVCKLKYVGKSVRWTVGARRAEQHWVPIAGSNTMSTWRMLCCVTP